MSGKAMHISGPTTLAPLIEAVAQKYESQCPGTHIEVNQADPSLQDSLDRLSAVEHSCIDIGLTNAPANAAQSGQQDHQLALVIFALVVNSKVTGLTNLSSDQIRAIYNGNPLRSTPPNSSDGELRWNNLESTSNLDVVRISRPPTSGTRLTFETSVLQNPETIAGPPSLITDTSQIVAREVQTTDGAIGYESLCYAELTPARSTSQSSQTIPLKR